MRPQTRSEFTVAIFCALPLEADAVEALFDETYGRLNAVYGRSSGDANTYTTGRIGQHNVVLCHLPGMGKGTAASAASGLRASYSGIELALVVGICGGIPFLPTGDRVLLGDIIVSDSVIEYDFGRQYLDGFQRKTGVKDTLGRPNREVRGMLAALKTTKTQTEFRDHISRHLRTLQQASSQWQPPGNTDPVSVHIGTIASADTVMKSEEDRDRLARTEGVIAFEMEGSGVWDDFSCVIIKGVCDYADSHKDKEWQAYAAATGASGAKAFLEHWQPISRNAEKLPDALWMIPFLRNPRFVGRNDEIFQVEELISRTNGPRKIAITGLGGIGKTQIALELAYRVREHNPDCSVFWIPATSHESIEQAYLSIAQMLGLHNTNVADVKTRVKRHLSEEYHGNWLLIFDNADDSNMWFPDSNNTATPAWKDFLPQSEQGHVLFTSRNRALATRLVSSSVISIADEDETIAGEILDQLLIDKSLLDDRSATCTLLEQLAFLPLAIGQAAAYMNQNGIGPSQYLDLLQTQEPEVIDLLGMEFEDDWRYQEMESSVASTWLISLSQIQIRNQLAVDYLYLMACIDFRNIPQSLLPRAPSKRERIEALGLLHSYSLVSVDPGSDGPVSLHRLVRLATRNWMRRNGHFSDWIEKTADRFSQKFPTSHHENRMLWREYLPHAQSLFGESEFQQRKDQHASLLRRVACCLDEDGRLNEAEKLIYDVITIERRKGRPLTSIMDSINRLAWIYLHQGRPERAERLQVKALNSYGTVLGRENNDILRGMQILGTLYSERGEYTKAIKLLHHVVDGFERKFGPGNYRILGSIVTLASIYNAQKKTDEAERLSLQALNLARDSLGLEHPKTMISMYNLAERWHAVGRRNEALDLMADCARLREKYLGPDHPYTRMTASRLAEWRGEQDSLGGAESSDGQEMGMELV
ncbi:hypothetical protein ASPZODRAFT_1302736 [Penicilliopsis zonata CBS 506.65]|uniref:AAA+ ATPase domain-containing protein n=1 Tax=Penicilliopsis zonata CBS 506.65 TaxID=1073090 RepID=A0A1L9S5T2_9EURO|nr:hypothetical protein ASPZODRAFT_1302736 [Penicilliopsis zonata CBS 506.65]OJJ42522.1 hypothetical protein ASPZODRAFT_1302736 [Penicilliopsis zonata CBS 506.65]